MNSYIVNGTDLWPDKILENLSSSQFLSTTYEAYNGAPANLYDSLIRNALSQPDACCIVDDSGKTYTYAAVLTLTDYFATFLQQEYSVGHRTHVGLLLFNSIEFCTAFLALQKLRAVSVPLPTKCKKEEIFSLIQKSNLSLLICDRNFADCFSNNTRPFPWTVLVMPQSLKTLFSSSSCTYQQIRSKTSNTATPPSSAHPEDAAILLFTSGTTSKSKGVLLYNYNVMHAVCVYQKVLHITSEDRTVIPIPIYHVTGLIALFGLFLYTGGCIYLHRFFDAPRILSDIQKNHVTFLHGSPTVFSYLLMYREEYPVLPSLRTCACGSSNMPYKKICELHQWLPKMCFHTVYGLTETASPAAIFPDDAAAGKYIGSSGLPIPGTRFKICDNNGCSLPPGKTGTVMISGTVVLPAYYKGNRMPPKHSIHKNTAALEFSHDKEYLHDGWLDTGDVGYFNDQGYLYIVDRKKDMINRGGEKVFSFDIENALCEIEGIHQAAVVGIPDTLYGEVPAAVISLKNGYTLKPEDIHMYLQERLARFKIPVQIRIVPELPLTSGSKIDKQTIRQSFLEPLHK